mgnify:CR=1 FL=1
MKVLLTGANGYIGRRLKNILKNQQGTELRIFVRNKKSLSKDTVENFEVIEGDTFDKDALKKALEGVDTAYYLIHSLALGPKKFALLLVKGITIFEFL